MSNTLVQSQTTQYVVFKAEEYLCALPSQDVLKVVPMPPPDKGGMISFGLVQLGQYSIQMLHLAERIEQREQFGNSDSWNTATPYTQTADTKTPPFLIVLQNANEALYGIAVDAPPELANIHDNELRAVPAGSRLAGPLQWASYLAQDVDNHHQTLLILDLPKMILCRSRSDNNIAPQQPTLKSAVPEFILLKPSSKQK